MSLLVLILYINETCEHIKLDVDMFLKCIALEHRVESTNLINGPWSPQMKVAGLGGFIDSTPQKTNGDLNLKLKRMFIFQTSFLGFHVCFRGF